MRLLSELLTAPVTGPARALGFVMKGIYEQVKSEYLDEGKVQAELLDLTLRYEHHEITEEQFTAQEELILRHLKEIQEYKLSEADALSASAGEGDWDLVDDEDSEADVDGEDGGDDGDGASEAVEE